MIYFQPHRGFPFSLKQNSVFSERANCLTQSMSPAAGRPSATGARFNSEHFGVLSPARRRHWSGPALGAAQRRTGWCPGVLPFRVFSSGRFVADWLLILRRKTAS